MEQIYADRLYEANCHPMTHAIIACMLGRDTRQELTGTAAHYVGKAIVTSDGYVQCNFVDREGNARHGAFISSYDLVEENIQLVAEDLSIPEEQTGQLIRDWISVDYRPVKRSLFA